MNHIYIVPGASNPEGRDDGHWKIMFEENGKSRHLNDAQDHLDAVIKGEKAAAKRGVSFELAGVEIERPAEVDEVAPTDPDEPSYMSVPRPRGAPALGDTVTFNGPDGPEELLVVDYLSEQFVGLADGARQRIVHISEDWKIS
jgi:hypothetical protein